MNALILGIILFLVYPTNTFAQRRDFSKWDHTAFCSYTKYHPHQYLMTDNNWDIVYELRAPHIRQYLDSIGIKNTDSQMMLLNIEGFIRKDGSNWVSLMPILDSIQTVDARAFSLKIAKDIYPLIKDDCSLLVDFLQKEKLAKNTYSILFSYVLDGEIWEHFNSFEDLKTSATWSGECWALYFPREFSSGSNSFDNFNVCWSDVQPDFVWSELKYTSFINPFLQEYKKHGKIISPDIFDKALALGLINDDGSLCIPVINSKDSNNPLNILSLRIINSIVDFFNTGIVTDFQGKFGINPDHKKLACTMLYHEVMWDIIDLLLIDNLIQYPKLWINKDKASIGSVAFIRE